LEKCVIQHHSGKDGCFVSMRDGLWPGIPAGSLIRIGVTAVTNRCNISNEYKSRIWDGYSLLKTVCRTDAAVERPWMAN